MKKMYGLMVVLALGSTQLLQSALVYPVEIENRSNRSIKIYLYDKLSGSSYSPNIMSPRPIYLDHKKKKTFYIGDMDFVRAEVTGSGGLNLGIDLVAPYEKYLIDEDTKKHKFVVNHRSGKSILIPGTPYNK
jgi:hypothetical protein